MKSTGGVGVYLLALGGAMAFPLVSEMSGLSQACAEYRSQISKDPAGYALEQWKPLKPRERAERLRVIEQDRLADENHIRFEIDFCAAVAGAALGAGCALGLAALRRMDERRPSYDI